MKRSGGNVRWSSQSSTLEILRRPCTALASEILKYRRALQLLAAAIGWASAVRPQNLESSVPSPTQRASCDRRARQPVC